FGGGAELGRDFFGAVGLFCADGGGRWIAHVDAGLAAVAADGVANQRAQGFVALDIAEHDLQVFVNRWVDQQRAQRALAGLHVRDNLLQIAAHLVDVVHHLRRIVVATEQYTVGETVAFADAFQGQAQLVGGAAKLTDGLGRLFAVQHFVRQAGAVLDAAQNRVDAAGGPVERGRRRIQVLNDLRQALRLFGAFYSPADVAVAAVDRLEDAVHRLDAALEVVLQLVVG